MAQLFKNVERSKSDMHKYQITAKQFLKDNPFSALFIDLGLGKSIISLTTILELILDSNFEEGPALVIAPVRVANETWPTEIGLWGHTCALTHRHVRNGDLDKRMDQAGERAREQFKINNPEPRYNKVDYDSKQEFAVDLKEWKKKIAEVSEAARLEAAKIAIPEQFKRTREDIHIVNRENVEFLVSAWGHKWPYKTVIIDESSSFKDHSSGRFKALRRARPLMKRMHQLTATPCAESYLGLFAQIYLLDQGERLGKSLGAYREKYFTENRYNHTYKLRPGAEEQITALISDICLVMKAEDYLPMEKPVILKDVIHMSDDEMKLYTAMETEQIITLPSGEVIEAETAASVSQKLLQMASGVIYETKYRENEYDELVPYRVVHDLHRRKIDKLADIQEQAEGENLLVAYWHDSSLARLQKAFPKAVVMDKDGTCVKAWNNGKIPMLLMHPMSGGHGLNLQKGSRRMVFFDIPWSAELYQQFVGRLNRQGQKNVVMIHHIIAEGTIDLMVMECLIEKRDVQDAFFSYLKAWRKRQGKRDLTDII